MAISYFDEIFFSNYIKEEDEVLDVCHKHIVTIIDTIVLWMIFWAIIPSFFFFHDSFSLRDYVPFMYFEIYLFLIYIILLYKIFDWYNDTWIITDKWIIDLDWTFMQNKIVYIDYSDVKWIELQQENMLDWLLWKWKIQIHSVWWGTFVLEDAKNPWSIVSYIHSILEEAEKWKKEKEKTINEKLLSTLKSVIKEHLDKNWLDYDGKEETENIPEEEQKEKKELEKVLKKAWTIDLRI